MWVSPLDNRQLPLGDLAQPHVDEWLATNRVLPQRFHDHDTQQEQLRRCLQDDTLSFAQRSGFETAAFCTSNLPWLSGDSGGVADGFVVLGLGVGLEVSGDGEGALGQDERVAAGGVAVGEFDYAVAEFDGEFGDQRVGGGGK